MKRGSTNFLRVVVICLGLFFLGLCAFALPAGIRAETQGDFDYGILFAGLYLPAIPLFVAFHQALKLLGYIDQGKAFSELSIAALKNIKYCALVIAVLFAAGIPYIFYLAEKDDAPGVAALGLIIVGASVVIATTSALFQQLFQAAVDIKTENDLTV